MDSRRIRSVVASLAVAAVASAFVQLGMAGTQADDLQAVPVVDTTSSVAPAPPRPADLPREEPGARNHTRPEPQGVGLPAADGHLLVLTTPSGIPTLDTDFEPPLEDTHIENKPTEIKNETVPGLNLGKGSLLSLPVQGRSSSRFGMRFHPVLHRWKLHTGHDWAAPCGTPVGAAAAGVVVKTGYAGGNGTQVKIDHGMLAGHRVFTTYNHLSSIGVRVGQQVSVHQGVGRVGNTGYSTGCHLHFEVIADGQFTDPIPWLNGQPVIVDTAGMGTMIPTAPATSATPSESPTPTVSPTSTPTPTVTVTVTVSPTASASSSPTASVKPSVTATPSHTASPSATPSASASPTTTPSASATPSTSGTTTPSATTSATPTPPASTPPPTSTAPSTPPPSTTAPTTAAETASSSATP